MNGWYASAAYGNCDEACEGVGLTCNEDDMFAHNADVSSGQELKAMVLAAGGTPTSSGCHSEGHNHKGAPCFKDNQAYCLRSNLNRPRQSISCSHRAGPDYQNKRRLCYCSGYTTTTTTTTTITTTTTTTTTTTLAILNYTMVT